MKAPDLVRVAQLGREAEPPVSSEVMLRRLRKLEKTLRRRILFRGFEGVGGGPWLADRTFLNRMTNRGGRTLWDRLRGVEEGNTDLRTEVGECKRQIAEIWQFLREQ